MSALILVETVCAPFEPQVGLGLPNERLKDRPLAQKYHNTTTIRQVLPGF